MIALRPASPDVKGYDALLRESVAEGHGMLERLRDGWRNGTNRFSQPGEALLGAFDGAILMGICGRNIDPYRSNRQVGRIRHLYVSLAGRRQGLGRLLVTSLAEGARPFFDRLNVRAPEAAHGFYERLGFMRVDDDPDVTHVLHLNPQPRHRTAPSPIR